MEPGVDRQVLGRRWLSDSGSISLSEVEAPGRLWMTLVIPDIEPGVRRLVLDPAFQETRVLLRNECAASELELTGAGRHEIELPVPVPPSGDHCRVLVEPNFYLVVAGVAEHRTVLLETLAWHPQPSVPTAR